LVPNQQAGRQYDLPSQDTELSAFIPTIPEEYSGTSFRDVRLYLRNPPNVTPDEWFEMKLNWEDVCRKCILAQKRKSMPYVYSEGNSMDPGEMPDGLQPLTQVEEMLIARAHVQMVMKRVRGHQYHYSGHTVTFLQDIVKFSSVLPLLPEDLDIVLLKPPAAAADLARFRLQFARDMKVRRGVVLAWLCHLKQHHPDYRHITILQENLSQLGDISHRLPVAVDDNVADPIDETTGIP